MENKKEKKILVEVREVMRRFHYSIHTERSYCDWIRRFILYHKMSSRAELKNGEEKIEQFLTHLAVEQNVAPATQNQAMNALIFLYKRVLKQELIGAIDAVRSKKKVIVPTVLSQDEVTRIIPVVGGISNTIVKLLYGSGLRVSEVLRLRVKDIDFELKQIIVRNGKGNKDRVTPFPESLVPVLQSHKRLS